MSINETWQDVSLGQICEFRYGKSLPATSRRQGPYPVYGSNGQVGTHTSALTDGPTIVIGRKGSVGEISYSETSCWPIDTTYFIDSAPTDVDLRWLAYQLKNLGLTELNKAAAIPGLNRDDAYRKRLLLPPLEEQLRVVEVLDRADALRAKRREAIARLDELTQSLFLDMFGDPATNPMGWEMTTLANLGSVERGISKHRPRNDPQLLGGIHPLIQTGDVARSNGYIDSYESTYSDLGLSQSKMWPAGTLCITIAANIARTGILQFPACFPDSVVGFSAGPTVTQYIHTWFGFVQESLERAAPESAQKNINLKILKGFQIPKPPDSLISRFTDHITKIRETTARNSQQLRLFDDMFASLQQRAFRGEL